MWGDYGRLCESKRLLSDFFAVSNDFVIACGHFFIFLLYIHSILKIQVFIQFFRLWTSWLGHFIGYSFGLLRKKTSTVSYDTAFR